MSELNPFKIAQAQLAEAAEIMDLDPAVHELLRWPLREFHVTLAGQDGRWLHQGLSWLSACSTTMRGAPRRAAFASTPTRPLTRFGLWRHG